MIITKITKQVKASTLFLKKVRTKMSVEALVFNTIGHLVCHVVSDATLLRTTGGHPSVKKRIIPRTSKLWSSYWDAFTRYSLQKFTSYQALKTKRQRASIKWPVTFFNDKIKAIALSEIAEIVSSSKFLFTYLLQPCWVSRVDMSTSILTT